MTVFLWQLDFNNNLTLWVQFCAFWQVKFWHFLAVSIWVDAKVHSRLTCPSSRRWQNSRCKFSKGHTFSSSIMKKSPTIPTFMQLMSKITQTCTVSSSFREWCLSQPGKRNLWTRLISIIIYCRWLAQKSYQSDCGLISPSRSQPWNNQIKFQNREIGMSRCMVI